MRRNNHIPCSYQHLVDIWRFSVPSRETCRAHLGQWSHPLMAADGRRRACRARRQEVPRRATRRQMHLAGGCAAGVAREGRQEATEVRGWPQQHSPRGACAPEDVCQGYSQVKVIILRLTRLSEGPDVSEQN